MCSETTQIWGKEFPVGIVRMLAGNSSFFCFLGKFAGPAPARAFGTPRFPKFHFDILGLVPDEVPLGLWQAPRGLSCGSLMPWPLAIRNFSEALARWHGNFRLLLLLKNE